MFPDPSHVLDRSVLDFENSALLAGVAARLQTQ
jgi:hypothetical protein